MFKKFLIYSRPLTLPFAFGWVLMLVVLLDDPSSPDFDYFFATPMAKLLFIVLTAASIGFLIAYGVLFVKWLDSRKNKS